MKGRVLFILVAVVLIFSLVGHSHAQTLTRVVLNCNTRVQPSIAGPDQQLQVFIWVSSNPVGHPPNFIRQISVTAPDGSVFSLDPDKDWLPMDFAYYRGFRNPDFVGGRIAGGTYRATVTPVSGAAIVETDAVPASFLSIPILTYPAANQTDVPAMPRITWDPVPNATFYRVMIWNVDWREPVWHTYDSRMLYQTDLLFARVPKGILKPNTRYEIQIQARGDSNDTDRRSQTAWIPFRTAVW
jgi:hypothetical protein